MPTKRSVFGVWFRLSVDRSLVKSHRADEAGCISVRKCIVACLFDKTVEKGSIKRCVSIICSAYEMICSSEAVCP